MPVHTAFRIFSVSILLVMQGVCLSQIRDRPEIIGAPGQDSIPDGIMPLDTPVAMSYIRMDDPRIQIVQDTLGWDDMQHDALQFGDVHLGNRGSATRSLILRSYQPIGYDHGLFQYHRYFIQDTTLRYYNQAIPVLRAKFSRAGNENTHLILDFGRRFANGVTLSLQYNRINQVGRFNHQWQKDTGLGIGVYHDAPSGKYDAFYSIISNAAITEENGGIQSLDDIANDALKVETIPTRITQGNSNIKLRSFVTKQIFHLAGDSASFGFDIWLKAGYKTALYKNVDEDAAVQTDYYPALYRVDDRGIRQYAFSRTLEESIGISLPWLKANSVISASLRYRNIKVDQEPEQRIINELYLEGEGDFQWIEPLQLRGKVSVGLGQAEGNYAFEANGELKLGELGSLTSRWAFSARKPYGIESKLYVNQQLIYNTDLKNPFQNDVEIHVINKRHLLDAGIRWIVLDNYIYFDSLALPQQVDGSFSIRQLFVSKEFDFRWIGLIAKGWWQPEVRTVLAIPDRLVSLSVYGRINFFKRKLTIIPGIDFTHIGEYAGSSYFPVNGVYHLTDEQQIPSYARIDAGVGMRLKFLKVFIRMEDVEGLLNDRALYQAQYYPHYQGYLRLGLEAGFFN